jgi:excisionase family DNA binding protein
MNKETISLINGFCKPLVNSGLLSVDEYKNVIRRLREHPKRKERELELTTRMRVKNLLKVSLRTVDRLADEGYLQRVKVGKRSVRFLLSDVEQLMENRELVNPSE